MTGDLFSLKVKEDIRIIQLVQLLNKEFPDAFDKPENTRIIRPGNKKGLWEDEEIVEAFIDLNYFMLKFPMVCTIPRSQETCLFVDIPDGMVRVVKRGIPDERIDSKSVYALVEWNTHRGYKHSGYVCESLIF